MVISNYSLGHGLPIYLIGDDYCAQLGQVFTFLRGKQISPEFHIDGLITADYSVEVYRIYTAISFISQYFAALFLSLLITVLAREF